MCDSRTAAFNVLYDIEKNNAYSNLSLNKTIKENSLSSADSAFACAVVYGVLERRITLDFIIRQYTKKTPLRKIETRTLIILRMGFYQLLYMDKVPDSAAVNESVKLAKKLGLQKSSGFINAVMREFLRNGRRYSPPQENSLQRLSVEYSCPQELISLWQKDYGDENTQSILQSLAGRPELSIRVNTLKTDSCSLRRRLADENIIADECSFLENALQIEDAGSLESVPAFKNGEFYVQDVSSQLCIHFLNPKAGEVLLDVCCAPGGKAFTSAQYMENTGEIYACDIHPHKVKLVEKTAEKLGVTIIKARIHDAAEPRNPGFKADKVLCDVPCSGLGVLRRKPEIRYKKDFNIEQLSALQYKILQNNSKYVAQGGLLVYSTCTLNRLENNVNADRFLAENKDFAAYPLPLPNGIERRTGEKENQLTLFPGVYGSDGFFISAFKRRA